MKKTCSECLKLKPLTFEFYHKSGDGFHTKCKMCRVKTARSDYQSDRLANIERSKSYYRSNSEAVRLRQKGNRFIGNLASGIRRCDITRSRKHQDPFYYIGLPRSEIRAYFESLFEEGMTWNNYGNPNGDHSECWNIDHKIPIATFMFHKLKGRKLEEALHKVCHYSNLRPMWSLDNIAKGNR